MILGEFPEFRFAVIICHLGLSEKSVPRHPMIIIGGIPHFQTYPLGNPWDAGVSLVNFTFLWHDGIFLQFLWWSDSKKNSSAEAGRSGVDLGDI